MKNNNRINEIKIRIDELTNKIHEQWTAELGNYKEKDNKGNYYYINGGWDAWKETNKDYLERERLQRELKEITPAPTIKERLKTEQNYLESAGLLRTAQQRKQWRLTKQGLINTNEIWQKGK